MTTAAADELDGGALPLGERAAFGELVERWHHPLWSFAHRMVGGPARSDDLTQEIWLRVVCGLPRLAAPGRFPALAAHARRTARLRRARQSYRRVDTDPSTTAEETGPTTDTDDFGSRLDRLDLESVLAELAAIAR